MNDERGFTLIELMIVIAIIGVLSTIALPTYQDRIIRAQIEEAMTLTASVRTRVHEHYRRTGEFPPDNESAGVPAPQHLIGNYVTSVEVHDGAISAHLGNRINAHVGGKVLTVRPAIVVDSPASPIAWLCGYAEAVSGMAGVGANRTTVPDKLLPYPCRSWSGGA